MGSRRRRVPPSSPWVLLDLICDLVGLFLLELDKLRAWPVDLFLFVGRGVIFAPLFLFWGFCWVVSCVGHRDGNRCFIFPIFGHVPRSPGGASLGQPLGNVSRGSCLQAGDYMVCLLHLLFSGIRVWLNLNFRFSSCSIYILVLFMLEISYRRIIFLNC